MSDEPAQILARLIEVCRNELQMLREGDVDAFERSEAEREHLFGLLPAELPDQCLPQLQELKGVTQALQASLDQVRGAMARELFEAKQQRQTREAYEGSLPDSGGFSSQA